MSKSETLSPLLEPLAPSRPSAPSLPVSSPRNGRPARVLALDGLRLTAALMVVMYHFVNRDGAWAAEPGELFPYLSALTAYGWLGVQLFFLISGFVICLSCWGRSLGDFFTSRVVRLFPAYWCAMAVTATVLLLTTGRRALPPWSDVFANVTMLQQPLGAQHIDGVYWSLFAELRFYVLFAALAWWGLTYRRVLGFCWVWVVASMLLAPADAGPARMLVMPEHSWYFIAGIAFYLIHRFGPNLLLVGLVVVCFCACLPGLHDAWANTPDFTGQAVPFWPVAVILAGGFGAMTLVATGRLTWIQWRWLPYAGALTYPLYLLHQNIGRRIIRLLEPHLTPYAVLTLAVLTLLTASWLVHLLVEKPVGRRLKHGMTKAASQVRACDRAPLPAPAQPYARPHDE
ncbi:acyltransferase family protein [Streptomyces sp. NPDC051561]|uniref:acyltransferase family protein n=1 Tax=Streptomyces sp. NPDC051561 TaxID=3365658 RepID=UPI0037B7FA67